MLACLRTGIKISLFVFFADQRSLRFVYILTFEVLLLDSLSMAENSVKRKDCEADGDVSDDEWVGPLPSEASQPKKRKC